MNVNITHLYPDFLNLYGDRGNIAALKMRCLWRGIEAKITTVEGDDLPDLDHTDILFLGGGSDREQWIVCQKLRKIQEQISRYVEQNGVLLAVCGGYQLLGNFYQVREQRIEGLQLIDFETIAGDTRLIGNVLIDCEIDGMDFQIAGFENHAGRTNIKNNKPFGRVVSGFGNNGQDGWEGILYKNVIGTYLHGPILPKNAVLTDLILERALKKKYPEFTSMMKLEDRFETIALQEMKERMLQK